MATGAVDDGKLIPHITTDASGKRPEVVPYGQDANPMVPAAAALADATANPTTVLVGSMAHAFNGTTWDRVRVDGQKNLLVGIRSSAGGEPTVLAPGSDGSGIYGNFGIEAVALPYLWNETTGDRQRGNVERTLLASASRSVTTNSPDQVNYNGKRLALIVDVSVPGTGSITPGLHVKDPVSGNYVTIWTAAAAITTQVTRAYLFEPGCSGGSWTEILGFAIPRTFRAVITANNGNAITYSVAAAILL
jgi:hypothetical protein